MLGTKSQREAVRVKVKKCEVNFPPEYKKFSVDPQITSLEVLYSILAKAFDLRSEFGISYKAKDPSGQEQWLVVLSDWDLDAAFLRAHNLSIVTASEPCLNLKVEVKPFQETPAWENTWVSAKMDAAANLQQQIDAGHKYLLSTVEKGFSIFQKALNFVEDPAFNLAPVPPMSDMDFRQYCDSVGQIIHEDDLRRMIYLGGIDSSLRRVLWKLLLNVYPDKMTGKERMDYMKRKSNEYVRLREVWRNELQKGNVEGELSYVTGMVRKDVLRTDRLHPFYAGNDDNQNIAALFNILTTYSLNHPSVSYCQGMSDFCSCILVSMQGDEAQAYICFCALMHRIKSNFMIDGIAMTQKFAHLSEALEYYDPEFFAYLKMQQADDLLFCYRWLLLEMKREFAFDDALFMLEVLWSTIPSTHLKEELPLFEKEFEPQANKEGVTVNKDGVVLRKPRENAYTKVCALRRQSSSISMSSTPINIENSNKLSKRMNQSLDENATRERLVDTTRKHHLSLDETKVRLLKEQKSIVNKIESIELDDEVMEAATDVQEAKEQILEPTNPFADFNGKDNNQCIADFLTYHMRDEPKSDSTIESNNLSLHFNYKKHVSGLMGSQMQDLKEKLNAGKKGLIASLDKIEKETTAFKESSTPKLVKNFNEFWNITTINKNSISDKIGTPSNVLKHLPSVELEDNSILKPLVKFTKNSLDLNPCTELEIEKDNKPDSSPDDSQDYVPMTTQMTRELKLKMESLERQILSKGSPASTSQATGTYEYSELTYDCNDQEDPNSIYPCESNPVPIQQPVKETGQNEDEEFNIKTRVNSGIFFWENPLPEDLGDMAQISWNTNHQSNTCDELKDLTFDHAEIILEQTEDGGKKSITPIRLVKNNNAYDSDTDSSEKLGLPKTNIAPTNPFYDEHISHLQHTQPTNQTMIASLACEASENDLTSSKQLSAGLPPPHELFGGNPFLLFLSLTLLLQHRDTIIRSKMDYNEMAIHFDKMVRKHSVHRVLNQARKIYADYLKLHKDCVEYYKIANKLEENVR